MPPPSPRPSFGLRRRFAGANGSPVEFWLACQFAVQRTELFEGELLGPPPGFRKGIHTVEAKYRSEIVAESFSLLAEAKPDESQ